MVKIFSHIHFRTCIVSEIMVDIPHDNTLELGALILEHVSEIMADTCNVNTRQKKNIK